MNKTQRAIIDRARANGGIVTVERACGYFGRKAYRYRSYGNREMDAGLALEKAGVMVRINYDRHIETHGNGNQSTHSSLTLRLQEECAD